MKKRLDEEIQHAEDHNLDEPARWCEKAQALLSLKASISPNTKASTPLAKGALQVPNISISYIEYICSPSAIEISHSRKSAQLSLLVKEYIGQTDGKIQTARTVDIEYRNRAQRATER